MTSAFSSREKVEIDLGASIYYVRVFWSFLEPPNHYIRPFLLHKVRENCHFLDHPPTPISLRNIKMAPYAKISENVKEEK